eukprot:51802-Prorocentrum_minimum.AAC.1
MARDLTVGASSARRSDVWRRAATKEGKLQVELAFAEYQLPRLTRMWSHLDRIGGGGQRVIDMTLTHTGRSTSLVTDVYKPGRKKAIGESLTCLEGVTGHHYYRCRQGPRGEKWEKVGNLSQGERRGRVSTGVLCAPVPSLGYKQVR